MLSREYMEKVIKETDTRIPVPKIKAQTIGCPVCGKFDSKRPSTSNSGWRAFTGNWSVRSKSGFEQYIKHFQKEHLKPKVWILYYTDPYDTVGCDCCEGEIGIEQKTIKGIFSTKALAEQTKKKIKSKIPYKEEDFDIESVIMDTRL